MRIARTLACLTAAAAGLATQDTFAADYYCVVGSSAIEAPGDGTGSGCLLWDGVSAPPGPPAPSGGGGGTAVSAPSSGAGRAAKDACPLGDLSPSYYDDRCDADPSADALITSAGAKLNSALSRSSAAARGKVVSALSSKAAAGFSIRAFPKDSRRILESVAAIAAAGTGTVQDMPAASESCSADPSYADLSSRGVGRKLVALVSCGALPQGTVVAAGQPVYRAEAVALFASAFGLRQPASASAFSDVPASLAPLFSSAEKAGLVLRRADGSFGPGDPLTSADVRRLLLAVGAYSTAASAPDSEDPAEYADLVAALYAARKEAAAR